LSFGRAEDNKYGLPDFNYFVASWLLLQCQFYAYRIAL